MNKSCSVQEVAKSLKSAGSVLVVAHFNPDADAYGATCAMLLALKAAGKEVRAANESRLIQRYRFIPGTNEIKNNLSPADVVLILDCGSLARTGDQFKVELAAYPKLINVDHHISNDYFAHLNCVKENYSSTCEIVFEIIKEIGVDLSPDMATSIYAGISGDTGSFRYSSTTSQTFRVAASLIEQGADMNLISSEFWGSKSPEAIKLQAEAMRALTFHKGGRIAEVVVTPEMYKTTNSDQDDTEDLVERARDIKGVMVSALIKWDTDLWKVSLRSKDEKYNVSDVAASFGGGGHVMAAAFRWKKELAELRSGLVGKLEDLFKSDE